MATESSYKSMKLIDVQLIAKWRSGDLITRY